MKKYVRELILFGIALLLAGVTLTAANREEEKKHAYDMVFLGDSVIGNDDGIVRIVEERLGKSVYNGALGGTCMSFNNTNVWESFNSSAWCMAELAQAIYAEDWTSQLMAASFADNYREVNIQVPEYFYDRINTLTEIDFSRTEILLIEHGTNDYNCGQQVDSQEDKFDTSTFGGALRTTLSLLQEKYPDLRIVLVSPVYCEIAGEQLQKCYEADFGGGVLDEYIAAQKAIAEEYGVEWIDLYHDSGIWEDTIDTYLYDKLHPSEEGQKLLGNWIADYLLETAGD